MRRHHFLFAIACAAGFVASSAASAADLPRKAAPYAPAYYAPVWSGFYAGVNAGYGWASTNITNSTGSSNLNGFVYGGQVGYNWQAGNLVYGLEGDMQGSSQKRSDTGTIGGIAFTVDQKLPWFATARGRLGYAMGPWMLYATGGAAWVNYKLTVSALGASASDNSTKAAFTVGGGVEWMMMQNWSAKLEYLYIDTGNTTTTLFGTTFSGRAKDNVVRVGLNSHF